MMAAKTTLLAKVPVSQSMHHIRPITVLGAIYRLTGRVIFKQIVKHWAVHFPILISGGLPGRGEEAISNKAQLGGFTLDLRKAFNTFPRWPITFLWTRLGVPSWLWSFWINSLMQMSKFPSLHGILGSPISSTTGAPEGDSLSVLAMLALARPFMTTLYVTKLLLMVMPTIGGGRLSTSDLIVWLSNQFRQLVISRVPDLSVQLHPSKILAVAGLEHLPRC